MHKRVPYMGAYGTPVLVGLGKLLETNNEPDVPVELGGTVSIPSSYSMNSSHLEACQPTGKCQVITYFHN